MRETWYVLEDGAVADPNQCAYDHDGVLRHKSGVAVALKNGVPMSRGVDDADAERAKGREMKPEASGKPYKTREARAK